MGAAVAPEGCPTKGEAEAPALGGPNGDGDGVVPKEGAAGGAKDSAVPTKGEGTEAPKTEGAGAGVDELGKPPNGDCAGAGVELPTGDCDGACSDPNRDVLRGGF